MKNEPSMSTDGRHTMSNLHILEGLRTRLQERYRDGVGADYYNGFADAIKSRE